MDAAFHSSVSNVIRILDKWRLIMGHEILLEQCPTGSCGYGVKGGGGDCDGGNSSCANAKLAPPDSTFGDESNVLKSVTERINDKLAGIGAGPEGFKLSFLRTPIGIGLGWIRHLPNAEQQPPNPEYLRAEDPGVVDELMIDRRVSPGDSSAAGTWEYHMTDNGVICTPGTVATCWLGPFLVADPNSSYHPPAVREAAQFIIDELKQLDKEAHGRKLALIKRGGGMMLAWVAQQGQSAPTATAL